jgi:hypothetical protein
MPPLVALELLSTGLVINEEASSSLAPPSPPPQPMVLRATAPPPAASIPPTIRLRLSFRDQYESILKAPVKLVAKCIEAVDTFAAYDYLTNVKSTGE